MADNTIQSLGSGDWTIMLYSPNIDIHIKGELRIGNNLYSVFNEDAKCLGVFPMANVGGITDTSCKCKPRD